MAEIYVAISNPTKTNCLGSVIRSCVALGATEILIVGLTKFSRHGSHGTERFIRFKNFHTWEQARQYLKEKTFDICGIVPQKSGGSITSIPIGIEMPFTSYKQAFVLRGNTSTIGELDEEAANICDYFVHVPSLNDEYSDILGESVKLRSLVVFSIIMHHYTSWAGTLIENKFEGQKYVLENQVNAKCNTQGLFGRKVPKGSAVVDVEEVDLGGFNLFDEERGDY